MKKFIEFVDEKDRLPEDKSKQPDDKNTVSRFRNDMDYRKFAITKMSHLNPEDKNRIKHEMINLFSVLLDGESFSECIKFVLDKIDIKTDGEVGDIVLQKMDNFFKNPRSKGLGYIAGQNNMVNSPNPNFNGSTNNSNYQ
jgi:hypothetical protein